MSTVYEDNHVKDDMHHHVDSKTTRDLVIITGCNAVGKTSASRYLQEKIAKNKSSMIRHVADSQCLLEAMLQDDKEGGYHHTHDWCANDSSGHSHEHGEPLFPFTVLDNRLPNDMRTRFFEKLITLPETDELWFVEWAAGMNTNAGPLSEIDYSYAVAGKVMEELDVPARLQKRILAVVHIEAEMHIRSYLNKLRALPSPLIVEEIKHGTAFWQKDETVLRFYGKDDFYRISSLFEREDIYPVRNDGTPHFFKEKLEGVVKELQKKQDKMSVS